MKGYVCVEIPVKSYTKAYINHLLGDTIKLSPGDNVICNKLYDLLEHPKNHQRTKAKCRYNSKVKVYIGFETFKRKGCNLNHTNIRSFNRFVEKLLKYHFYMIMDTLCEIHPSFEGNLPAARRKLGIDLEAWPDDSMKKDYYRYRVKKNIPLFYKTFGVNVPSERADGIAF